MQRTTIGVTGHVLVRSGTARALASYPRHRPRLARPAVIPLIASNTHLPHHSRSFSSRHSGEQSGVDGSPTQRLTSDPTGNPTATPTINAKKQPNSSLVKRYQARLSHLSQRTGVPLPSLGLSFLVLHELTAIVPVVAIYWVFAYLGIGAGFVGWIYDVSHRATADGEHGARGDAISGRGTADFVEPVVEDAPSKWKAVVREWYEEGEKRVERVGRKYGILGYEKRDSSRQGDQLEDVDGKGDQGVVIAGSSSNSSSESGAAGKVADAIAAYVVVKALLPLRIGFSIAAAPAFARYTLVPLQQLIRRFRRST
ncbi:hypothetical protein IAU59_004793 [Kwoniella sp. CBS 9459]